MRISLRRPMGAVLVSLCLLAGTANAEPAAAATGGEAKPAPAGNAAFAAERSETKHRLERPDGALAYTAVAEFLPLRAGEGNEIAARIFTVTYTLDPDGAAGAGRRTRPVSFVFNGGPGASSAYLHVGALGPRTVAFNPDGSLPRPPAVLADNPDSWLAFTDLVFIDPVGTGFSRMLKADEEAEKKYWNIDGDTRSMAETVRLWMTRNGRWSSPSFLVGESYGGFRAAKLAKELLDATGIAVNGVIMVSPVVDFATIRDADAALLPWAFKLPAFAAAAAAHGKAPGTPADAAAAAERFALGDYVGGLARLDLADLGAARGMFEQLARLTGLPVELVERHRGRIGGGLYAREALRAEGRILSLYDATFTAPDPDPGASRIESDPMLDGTRPAFAGAYVSLVHDELKVATEVPFRLLSSRVNRNWSWPRMQLPSALDSLQSVLALSPGLRVLIAHGRTDLVTPYMASRWVAANLELPAGERDRVRVTVYDGGHMMYTRASERARLAADARALVEQAVR